MKTRNLAQTISYLGGWVGVILSLLFAVLPGIFVGGWLGLKISGLFIGAPLDSTIAVKIIMVTFMLWGLLTASAIYIVGSSLIGYLIGSLVQGKADMQEGG